MAFFNFFKKRNEIEKVEYTKLGNWMIDKCFEKEEQELIKVLKDKISGIVWELKKNIIILKGVNLDGKKEQRGLKLIVLKNLESYISSIERLARSLENLNEEDVEGITNKLILILNDFNKKTFTNYERATILVGKEIALVKESIINFSADLRKDGKMNSELTNKLKTMRLVKAKIDENDEVNSNISENMNKQIELEAKIKNLEVEKVEVEKNIIKIKRGDAYYARAEMKREKYAEIKSINFEKEKLKGMVDYKILAKKFHGEDKKMALIKRFRDNSGEIFLEGSYQKLENLFSEAEIDKSLLFEKIRKLLDRENIAREQVFEEDELGSLYMQTKEIDNRIVEMRKDVERFIKNDERFVQESHSLRKDIGKNLFEVGVEIVD